jgi:hypothetical protein
MEPQLISLSVSPYTRRVRVTLAVVDKHAHVRPATLCAFGMQAALMP